MQSLGSSRVTVIIRPPAAVDVIGGQRTPNICHSAGDGRLLRQLTPAPLRLLILFRFLEEIACFLFRFFKKRNKTIKCNYLFISML
jgi:hypothetical protein